MIVGVGTDICDVSRISGVWEAQKERFLERLLTEAERGEPWVARLPETVGHLARRWALKEAVAKAMGVGIGGELGFQDIQVLHTEQGAPAVVLRALADVRVHVSVSDDGAYACAFAVAERD